jgi:3-oxoacyl-[acyl-carrier-protein] synthase II
VAITGFGLVHPLARSPEELARALAAGSPPRAPEVADLDFKDHFPAQAKRASKMDRLGQYACCAALFALRHAGLERPPEPARAGVVGGSAFGGLEACVSFHADLLREGPELVSAVQFINTAHNVAASQVAISFGIQGPVVNLSSGLAAGLDAVVTGVRTIRAGRADLVLAGGYERWIPELQTALRSVKLLGDGAAGEGASLAPAEGACFLVLEEGEKALGRGAAPLAWVLGYGQSAAVSARGAAGAGLAKALNTALAMAGDPQPAAAIVGAQGTPRYDVAVRGAYEEVLGGRYEEMPKLFPKRALGEAFGAAGPLAIAAALATEGLLAVGPVLVDSLAWGGAGTAVVLGGAPGPGPALADLEERAKRGSREKFLAALAKVPDVAPDQGDEL